MYQAIYKCRLCGDIIKSEILMQPHVAHRIMRNFIYENEEALRGEPHPINKHDCHNCKDGSLGTVDFQGFKKRRYQPMTKQELMENFTKEGLTDEILAMEKICEIENIKLKYIEQLENKNKELLDTLCHGDWPEKLMEHDKKFTEKIEELQSEVEKYRKALEDAKKDFDCQITEYEKKIEELTEENNKLKGDVDGMNYQEKQDKTNNFYGIYAHSAKNLTKDDLLMFLGILTKELIKNGIDFRYEMEKELKVWDIKIESDKEITDFFPTEPIKVADMLINATYTRKKGDIEKTIYKAFGNNSDMVEENVFDISELRQIAEHLLVYCNHNGEAEE